MSIRPVLAVIPARGGSKGMPGKNIRLLAGLPLIGHSIRLSKLCVEIAKCIVSTDHEEIAAVARECGAEGLFCGAHRSLRTIHRCGPSSSTR
jgi:N-acylneuraminate cytidylyltransferase